MNVLNQKHELVALDRLAPHPKNPNVGDVASIEESISANGFYGTVVVQRSTGFILVGHHRFEAARNQGATEIPVTWVDVDDRAALRILLADNATAAKAHRDEEALAALLQEFAQDEGGLIGTGYDDGDYDALLAKLSDDLPASFKALDETIAEGVKHHTCPSCGHTWPA